MHLPQVFLGMQVLAVLSAGEPEVGSETRTGAEVSDRGPVPHAEQSVTNTFCPADSF